VQAPSARRALKARGAFGRNGRAGCLPSGLLPRMGRCPGGADLAPPRLAMPPNTARRSSPPTFRTRRQGVSNVRAMQRIRGRSHERTQRSSLARC